MKFKAIDTRSENIKLAKSMHRAKLIRPFFPQMYENIIKKNTIKTLNQNTVFQNLDAKQKLSVVKIASENIKQVEVKPNLCGTDASLHRVLAVVSAPIWLAITSAVERVILAKEALVVNQYVAFVATGSFAAVGPYALWLNHCLKNLQRDSIGQELREAILSCLPKSK
jgi:hypothetical protein